MKKSNLILLFIFFTSPLFSNYYYGKHYYEEKFDDCIIPENWHLHNLNYSWNTDDALLGNGNCMMYFQEPAHPNGIITELYSDPYYYLQDPNGQPPFYVSFDYLQFENGDPSQFLFEVFDGNNWITLNALPISHSLSSISEDITPYINPSLQFRWVYTCSGAGGSLVGINNFKIIDNTGLIYAEASFNENPPNTCSFPWLWQQYVQTTPSWFVSDNIYGRTIDGSCFAYFDDSLDSNPGTKNALTSPIYRLMEDEIYTLSLDYMFRDNYSDFLSIEINNGSFWQQIYISPPCPGGNYVCNRHLDLDITPYLSEYFQVRFVFDDDNYLGDFVGIDNFKISACDNTLRTTMVCPQQQYLGEYLMYEDNYYEINYNFSERLLIRLDNFEVPLKLELIEAPTNTSLGVSCYGRTLNTIEVDTTQKGCVFSFGNPDPSNYQPYFVRVSLADPFWGYYPLPYYPYDSYDITFGNIEHSSVTYGPPNTVISDTRGDWEVETDPLYSPLGDRFHINHPHESYQVTYNGVIQHHKMELTPLHVPGILCTKMFFRNLTGESVLKKVTLKLGEDLINSYPISDPTTGGALSYSPGIWNARQVTQDSIVWEFNHSNSFRGDGIPMTDGLEYEFCINVTPISNHPTTTTVEFDFISDGYAYLECNEDGEVTYDITGCLPISRSDSCRTYGESGLGVGGDECPQPMLLPEEHEIDYFDPALPVELLSFSVKKQSKIVALIWATASEKNNSHFEIEKSNDGKNWEQIGRVKGEGNSLEIVRYDFLDAQPFSGINYYRLKQVDFDGSFEYSKIKTIIFDDNGISFYPNPAKDIIYFDGMNQEPYILEISNVQGKIIFQGSIQNNGLDISELNTGVYLLQVYNKEGLIQTFKLIKE